MKKILLVTMLLVAIATGVYAANATMYNANMAQPFTGLITMAVTTTSVDTGQGASTSYSFSIPMSNFSCQELITGVTPTTKTVLLQGSHDGTNWTTLATSTATASGRVDSTGKWASSIRINNSVLTKATGTTTVTWKCIAQQ